MPISDNIKLGITYTMINEEDDDAFQELRNKLIYELKKALDEVEARLEALGG